jgi:hypothetical protein
MPEVDRTKLLTDDSKPSRAVLGPTIWQRLRVLSISTIILSLISFVWTMTSLPFVHSIAERFQAWCIMLGGPFTIAYFKSETWAGGPSLCATAALLPAILAHPVRPRWWTALITVFGLVLWFYFGFAFVVAHV